MTAALSKHITISSGLVVPGASSTTPPATSNPETALDMAILNLVAPVPAQPRSHQRLGRGPRDVRGLEPSSDFAGLPCFACDMLTERGSPVSECPICHGLRARVRAVVAQLD